MKKSISKLPIWLSVVGCVLLYTSITGIGANCRGIFFSPVSEELGISLSRLTAFYVFYGIAAALATPLCCRIFRAFPISPVLTVMVTIYSASVFLMGYANHAETFYLLAAIQGTVGGFLVYYPAQTIISQWFPTQKGTILGFVLMSSGICGAVMNPVISQWISRYGWRVSFRIAGSLIFAMALTASVVCLHWDPPRDVLPMAKERKAGKKPIPRGSLPTIVLLYAFSLCVALVLGTSQHLPSLALDYGKTSAFGAKLVSASMIGNLIAKLVLGPLNDRIGAHFSALTGVVCIVGGCGLILFSSSDILLITGAFFIGFILALNSMHIPLLSRTLLGTELYDQVYPTICSVVSLIGSISSMILSIFHDAAGGYRPVIIYVGTVMAVCTVSVVLLKLAQDSKIPANC